MRRRSQALRSSMTANSAALIERMHEDDILVVTELSRLGRSLLEVMNILTFPLCCFDQIACWLPRNTP